MRIIKILTLFGLIALISCGKEQLYTGTYQGIIDVSIYDITDNDLIGSYIQDAEIVQFKILNDNTGDYFTWNNCLVSGGVNLPSPDPVYLNRRGKGKLNFHIEDSGLEWDIFIKVDIDDSGTMQYEAKVVECTDANGNGRGGIIVYGGELKR